MKSQTDIKKKLQEVENLMEDRRGVFLYWLGFKRALEWILNEQTTTKPSNKK